MRWRFQFGLRDMLVFVAACALLLGWWLPTGGEVQRAGIEFERWQPATAAIRIRSAEDRDMLIGWALPPEFDPVNFSRSDVIPVPLNGLPGQPTAEYRVESLGRYVDLEFRGTPLREVADRIGEELHGDLDCQHVVLQLGERGTGEDLPITFQARGVPLREALHDVLQPLSLNTVRLFISLHFPRKRPGR